MSGNLPSTLEAVMLFWTYLQNGLKYIELAMLVAAVLLLVRMMWKYSLEQELKYRDWCKRNRIEDLDRGEEYHPDFVPDGDR